MASFFARTSRRYLIRSAMDYTTMCSASTMLLPTYSIYLLLEIAVKTKLPVVDSQNCMLSLIKTFLPSGWCSSRIGSGYL